MEFLLDTNILVPLANSNDARRGLVFDALATLHRRGDSLWVAPQCLVELWSVCTRPTNVNGLGLSPADAADLILYFESEFRLAAETPDVFQRLKSIATVSGVIGKQIHDARLVATCHAHDLKSILSFNERHFRRFSALPPGLSVVQPQAIVPVTG